MTDDERNQAFLEAHNNAFRELIKETDEVASQLRHDLVHAIEVLQHLVAQLTPEGTSHD